MTSFGNKIKMMTAIGMMTVLSVGCSNSNTSTNRDPNNGQAPTGNGMYYWRTTFDLSPKEYEFLKRHDIERLYVKLFDVDMAEDFDGTRRAIPIATTLFCDTIPAGIEIVPVVYITQNAIHNNPEMDSLLYDRIRAMGKRNGFDGMREIQFDCDWTTESRPLFFRLCQKMRQRTHSDSIQLSATIRLHQLRDSIPPVDRGVLMMYNTGSLYNPQTRNSILDEKDVKPYLQSDIHYNLPLSVAYPTYSWAIQFRFGEFLNIVHRTDFSDTEHFEKTGKDLYRTKEWLSDEEHCYYEDDVIRVERGETEQIEKVKNLLQSRLHPAPLGHILYHLDEQQLSHYTDNEIEKILK